jgi:hypothetical protein
LLRMDTAGSGAVGGSRRGLRSPETADRLALAHAIVAVGGALDELEVVGDLDERAAGSRAGGRSGRRAGRRRSPAG